MEDINNTHVYGEQCGEEGDQMYVITEDDNINIENFDIEGGQNVMELPNGELAMSSINGDQYIYYDESGQAYLIDSNDNESTSMEFINNSGQNSKAITYNCPLCPQTYQNANAFTKHAREKHFVKVFTCRQCEKFFDSLSQLFLHARRSHSDPQKPDKNPSNYKFHCPDCKYMTNNNGTMEHHRRAHSGFKPYKCDICDKSFAQKANMKTHKNRHIHKERIFLCDTCNKSFNSHDIYLAHLRTREHELHEHFKMIMTSKVQIQCLGCNEEFGTYYDVNKHSRKCEILTDLASKFWCIQCKTGFATSLSLKRHLKEHGGTQDIVCPVCGERGFPGFNQLNHHITRAHSLKVNRRNVCRYCEMTFEAKDTLTLHIDEMHACEKNARQSRGAAGRLQCRYEHCDFTSNSVMQMDRHHDQHVTDTLPCTAKKVVRRPKKLLQPLHEKEEMLDMQIEHFNSVTGVNEVFRVNDYNDFDDDVKLELLDGDESMFQLQRNEENIDDMDVDDLEKLAASYMEKPSTSNSVDGKRKRGRPRKFPIESVHYDQLIKGEYFDVTDTYSQSADSICTTNQSTPRHGDQI